MSSEEASSGIPAGTIKRNRLINRDECLTQENSRCQNTEERVGGGAVRVGCREMTHTQNITTRMVGDVDRATKTDRMNTSTAFWVK